MQKIIRLSILRSMFAVICGWCVWLRIWLQRWAMWPISWGSAGGISGLASSNYSSGCVVVDIWHLRGNLHRRTPPGHCVCCSILLKHLNGKVNVKWIECEGHFLNDFEIWLYSSAQFKWSGRHSSLWCGVHCQHARLSDRDPSEFTESFEGKCGLFYFNLDISTLHFK